MVPDTAGRASGLHRLVAGVMASFAWALQDAWVMLVESLR